MLSATLYDEAILHPYDYHDRMYELVVRSDNLRERYGVLSLRGHWGWHAEPASGEPIIPVFQSGMEIRD